MASYLFMKGRAKKSAKTSKKKNKTNTLDNESATIQTISTNPTPPIFYSKTNSALFVKAFLEISKLKKPSTTTEE